MSATTFYWHDYETFGADPRRDRAAQFAGIRTDADLNEIGEPLNLYCQPAPDFLPNPESVLITGITPQLCLQRGLPEAGFIAAIHQQLAQPGTCGVGYNTIRFDDEFTRQLLYRNFYDPYAREWQNGCSRWDILDMLRLARALRPEGIAWPCHPDGKPSFRLEHLTQANGLAHEAAHDALSDVRATIAVARLVKTCQPRLYDYVFQLRDKRKVAKLLNLQMPQPVLHVSGMFAAERGCLALVLPLAHHPVNANEVIVADLSADPSPLFELDAAALRERLFTRSDALPVGAIRPPLKTIHLNKCPVVATASLLTDDVADRWQIDRPLALQHAAMLVDHALHAKLAEVYTTPQREPITDPDLLLYAGGFWSNRDKASLARIRQSEPRALADGTFDFDDPRLPEMLFRYRARNFPHTLRPDEQQRWQAYCRWRLTDPAGGASVVLDDYLAQLRALADTSPAQPDLLVDLVDYGRGLLAEGFGER